MIKTLNDFYEKQGTIIQLIYQHSDEFHKYTDLSDIQLHDILYQLHKDDMVHGLHDFKLEQDKLHFSSYSLRLTKLGLAFYEQAKKSWAWGW